MRITRETVRKLSDEAERVTGRTMLESINTPGDGTVHYVMAESMISTYRGTRAAAAYLLGVLAGADPDGQVHYVDTRAAWLTEIDDEFKFGAHTAVHVRAHTAGYAYGRRFRDQELLKGTRHEGDPNMTVRHGVIHDKRYDRKGRYSVVVTYENSTHVRNAGTWPEITAWLASLNPSGLASVEIVQVPAEGVMPA
jgi:hypothetical protein